MNQNAHQTFKDLVSWFLTSIIVHIFGTLVYLVAIYKIVTDYINDQYFYNAYTLIFLFGCIFQIGFYIYHTCMTFTESENKTVIKKSIKEGTFTVLGHFKERYLKMTIYKVAIFSIFQLPVIICFPFFGINLQIFSFIGGFNIIEAGAYAVSGSIFLGYLINVLVSVISYTLIQIIAIYLIQKDIRKNAVI